MGCPNQPIMLHNITNLFLKLTLCWKMLTVLEAFFNRG